MGYETMAPPSAVRSGSPVFKATSTLLLAFSLSVTDEMSMLLPHMMQQSQVRVLALHFVPFVHGARSWMWISLHTIESRRGWGEVLDTRSGGQALHEEGSAHRYATHRDYPR
jgi:hypothetical protein